MLIVHTSCKANPSRAGNPEFLPTTKRANPDEPTDLTFVYKCEACKMTVGVELVELEHETTFTVYI